ncbi:MAG: hypothetical protein ACLU62_13300, partial [Hydrogeniiclostridium sp.]
NRAEQQNIHFFELRQTRIAAGFWGGQNEQSSRPFRVSPVMTTSITLRVYFNPIFTAKNHSKNFWGEKQERKQKTIRFLILKTQ